MRKKMLGLVAFVAAFATACSPKLADQSLASLPRAEIEVTSSPNTAVLIYASKPSPFALRGNAMMVRSDTLRVVTPARLTAILNAGDIHITADQSVPIAVVANLTHAPALKLTATGREIVVESGGAGITQVR
jgi:hypothetical protein